MKSAFGILLICFIFVACWEEIEPLKHTPKGDAKYQNIVYGGNGL